MAKGLPPAEDAETESNSQHIVFFFSQVRRDSLLLHPVSADGGGLVRVSLITHTDMADPIEIF